MEPRGRRRLEQWVLLVAVRHRHTQFGDGDGEFWQCRRGDCEHFVERADSVAHVFESHGRVQPNVKRRSDVERPDGHHYRQRRHGDPNDQSRQRVQRQPAVRFRQQPHDYEQRGADSFQLPTLAIGPNTVIGTPGFGGIIVTGTGSTTINGSFAPGANQVVGGITKTGNGILTLSGNDTNLGGGVSLSGGSLFLDYVASTATKLGTGALNLSGGTIKLFGNASTTLYDTAALGTTLGSGHTTLTMQTYQNGFSGPSIGIDLQTITRQAAGTLDVVLPNPTWNRVTTTTVLTNGIFGGWATYGSDTWATKGCAGDAGY